MRRHACLLLATAAAGCSGDDDGAGGQQSIRLYSTDLPTKGPPAIVSGQRVTFGDSVSEPTTRKVALFANTYPYEGWRRVLTARQSGALELHVRPAINTRYQLRLLGKPPVRSNIQQVYVDLEGQLAGYLLGPLGVEYRYRGRARIPVTPGNGRMHFYLQENGRGPLRKICTGKARQSGTRSILVTLRRRDSDPRQSDRFFSCAVGLLAKGFGHPAPSDPGCGKPVLTATKLRLSAGR